MPYIIFLLVMLLATNVAYSFVGNWDHEENAKQSARAIGKLAHIKGALAADAAIDACYVKHLTSSAFKQELEECIVQDIVHSRVAASLYKNISPEARKLSGSPDPQLVLDRMSKRVYGTLAKYKITVEEFQKIAKFINKQGPVFYMEGWKGAVESKVK